MRNRALGLAFVLIVILLGLVVAWTGRRGTRRIDMSHERPSSEARVMVEHVEPGSQENDDMARGMEPLAPPVAESNLRPDDEFVGIRASSLLDPSVLADMEETTLPTEEGLYLRTVDWWNQDDFLALTGDELHALLPVVEISRRYVLSGPHTLAELVNGLPTRADCERAFRDQVVRERLEAVCALEIPLLAIDFEPEANRTREFERLRKAMRASFDAAQLELMRELERATGYPHWTMLHRAFVAWSK